ncbi:MAG: anthranilate synthase component II [Thermoanaerobaculia bacterium]
MILVVDNYDSFTFNLVQMLLVAGEEVRVVRNDESPAEGLLELGASGIVLSPGPGRPEEAGVCEELIRARPRLPLLGVCLGHQALGSALGAVVERAPRLMHGKTSQIRHLDAGPFAGLPNPFEATRYHSLCVREETLPAELEALAWSEEGTLMGMRHRELPWWGVQFHPESILTRSGDALMGNFLALCRDPHG